MADTLQRLLRDTAGGAPLLAAAVLALAVVIAAAGVMAAAAHPMTSALGVIAQSLNAGLR